MSRPLKRGRASNFETQFILKHCISMPAQKIAEKLGRSLKFVLDFIEKNHVPLHQQKPDSKETERVEKVLIRQELKNSEKWKRLHKELTPDEIRFFEEEYIKVYTQFNSDVVPTEESQIFDSIQLQILKSRNMIERRKAREKTASLEKSLIDFVAARGRDMTTWDAGDRAFFLDIQKKIEDFSSVERSYSIEYAKLQERFDKIIGDLKATRNQRFRDIEEKSASYLGLIKALQQQELAMLESRQAGLMRVAAQREKARLSKPHTYADGVVDHPILNADTIEEEIPEPAHVRES